MIGLAVVPAFGLVVARRPFARTPVDLPLGLLLVLAILNLLITPDHAVTLPHVYKVIAGVALFYGVVRLLVETRWFDQAALAICLLGVVLIPLLIWGTQWSGAKFSWMPWTPKEVFPQLVLPFWKPEDATGFNSNLTGGILAMVLPIPLAYTLFRDGISRQGKLSLKSVLGASAILATGLETAAIGALLFLSQSRGALLAALTAVCVMLTARNPKWIVLLVIVLVGGTILFQATDLALPTSVDLESDLDSALNSADGRVELWSRGWLIGKDFPFTGTGMGVAGTVMGLRYPTFRIQEDAHIEHLHSLYANTIAESGVPGLVALLAWLGGIAVLFWQTGRHSRGSSRRPMILGALGTLTVIWVHGVTDTVFFAPKAFLIACGILAVGVAVDLSAQHEDGLA